METMRSPPFNLNVLDTLFQMNCNLVLQPLVTKMTMTSTSNYPIIPTLSLNQTCGVVTFI